MGDEEKHTFKDVPDSIEDITPAWCEEALRRGGIISSSTKVLSVDTDRLINDETGALDGGGMTATKMLRIKITYDVEDEKNPKSLIAKCMLDGKRSLNLSFFWRLMITMMYGKNFEESFMRTDIKFYREAIPHIKDVYSHPKVYYTGIIDGGNNSFYRDVIRGAPHKIRTITLMQDMKGWKSQTLGINHLTFDQAAAVLENLAVLHGNFWGEKNKEIREKFEPSLSETEMRGKMKSKLMLWKRNRLFKNSNNIRKTTKTLLKNWSSHSWYSLPKDATFPSWLTPNSSENSDSSRIGVLNDPNVLEMLEVVAERLPKFNTEYLLPFMKLPAQTILHGDIHNGNHMYDETGDKVKVVAFDFQMAGYGLAMADVVKLLHISKQHKSLDEDFELLKKYHYALVNSGVEDYSYNTLKEHFVLGFLEAMMQTLSEGAEGTSEKMEQMHKTMFGEEKWGVLKDMLDGGLATASYLFMTSIYLNDKDKFLIDTSFIDKL